MADLRFFTDRSLGDREVPRAWRDAGWQVVSMRERYGSVTAQELIGVDWIRDAVTRGAPRSGMTLIQADTGSTK